MNLRNLITEKIAQLDATGDKQAVIRYFQTHIPNITRVQLGGWKRSGKFPFEMAEAVFEHEMVETEEQPTPHNQVVTDAQVEPEPMPTARVIATTRQIEIPQPVEHDTFDEDEPPPTDLEDPTGMTRPSVFTNLDSAPRVVGRRQQDIRVLEPRQRNARAPGPIITPPMIDSATIAAVVTALRQQGWSPPTTQPAPAGPVNTRRAPPVAIPQAPRFRARHWNEPAQAR